MNKHQKEIELTKLSHEQKAFQELRKTYTQALADTKALVKKLQEDISILEGSNLEEKSILQSRIYQLNYQKAMEEQLTAITNVINSKNVTNVQTFLTKMYQDSYLGVNYNLQKSGIPIIMAVNPSLIVKSINTPTNKLKFSETLYERTKELKQAYKEEISRGIATGKGYREIAKQLDQKTQIGFNNAYRIVRTEGGRVSSEASMTAMREARIKGADVVKQWLATLDMRTRDTHGRLDGQIREIDEDFEIEKVSKFGERIILTTQAPHQFGIAEEDINCRCAVLSVPRWDVEDTYIRYDDKHGCLIESKNYQEWKDGYFTKIEENPEVTRIILEAEERIKGYTVVKTVLKEVSDKVDKVLGKAIENIPTLKNLDETINNYVLKLENEIKLKLEKANERKKQKLINYSNKISKWEKELANVLEQYDYKMNVHQDSLIKILQDGKFKNQFEAGKSSAVYHEKARKGASNRLFGTDISTTKNSEYEKYGYLGVDGSRVSIYGDIEIVFKKDNLRDRTTFFLGDSLYTDEVASFITKPSISSFKDNFEKVAGFYGHDIDDVIYWNDKVISELERNNLQIIPYVELQFHGDLTIDDIDTILIPKKGLEESEIQKALKLAKEKGIKVEFKDEDDF